MSSLLPTWHGTDGTWLTNVDRSTRLIMSSVEPSFKALIVPVFGASYGLRDTVFFPGSLLVHPELSPLCNNGEDEEHTEKKRAEQEADHEKMVRSSTSF